MRSWRQSALIAVTSVSVMVAASACGNVITADHSWKSLVAEVTLTAQAGGASATGVVLYGRLVDAHGRPLLSTVVQETCAKVTTPKMPSAAYRCLLLVNTGPHIYVAGGRADGPFGKLPSLAGRSTPGSISVTSLTKMPSVGKPLSVELSAVKG